MRYFYLRELSVTSSTANSWKSASLQTTKHTVTRSISHIQPLKPKTLGVFLLASESIARACFSTRREGYPSKRVNPGWSVKDSSGLQAKFHRYGNPTIRNNLMRGYTQRGLETITKLLTRVGGLTNVFKGKS